MKLSVKTVMESQQKIYFEFIQCALGIKKGLPASTANIYWVNFYRFAKKQSLMGVVFDGIQRLPNELAPNADLLMKWMGKTVQIRRQNMKVNMAAAKLYRQLREDGLRCCILKGQGNALMYQNPYSRTSGDIDVWVNDSRERIAAFAREHYGWKGEMHYHHLETTLNGVSVELHFLPCTMNNPIYNARLQKWFRRNGDLQCSNVVSLPDGTGEIAVPTASFNVIYQLCHLYHHFFDEGIGLRQIIDYYFVLVENEEEIVKKHRSPTEGKGNSTALQRELKHLGLWKFAGAVMWVLHEVLGLSEDNMIAPMNERRGKLLLAEILDGGNFGKHFFKYGHFTRQGMAKKYFLKIWRNMHFVRYYPSEALSEPVFRTWHFFWRVSHGIR